MLRSLDSNPGRRRYCPRGACVGSLRNVLHVSRDSYRRIAQGLYLSPSGCRGRGWLLFSRPRGKEQAAQAANHRTRWHLARDPPRRNLLSPGAERSGQIHHRRYPHHAGSPDVRPGVHWRARRLAQSGSRQAFDRRGWPASESGLQPDRPRDSNLPRRLLRPSASRADEARGSLARAFQTDRPRRPDGSRFFRRHDAAPLHRARHGARSAGAVSGRAQRRSRPADALAPVGDRSRVQPDRQNHSAHHAQHGRSRHALPAPCHHRPRPADRTGNSSRIEGFRPRRFSPAVAVRPALGGVSRAPAKAFRGSRSARHRRRWRRCVRGPRRLADSGIGASRFRLRGRTARCAYLRAEPRESLSAPYGKELARMNWKTFLAILARDAHVARRNVVALLFQTFLQPLMFVFIFGRVMVGSGYMPPSYKSLLLPGIMAICMVGTGIWAVAMPVIAEFQFTHEIEDRLLAPMDIILAGGREGRCGDAAIAGRRPDGDSGGLAFAATWCRPARTSPPSVCGRSSACGSFLRDGRPGARLQYAANPYRLDVQFDCGADDFLRLHLLSMERAREVPHHAESGARQSAGVRERRLARYAGAAVPASSFAGCPRCVGYLQSAAVHRRPALVLRQSGELVLP